MKKIAVFAVILVALCMTVFTGCEGKNSGGAGSGLPDIGVAIYKFDDTFM